MLVANCAVHLFQIAFGYTALLRIYVYGYETNNFVGTDQITK
jgi:hypothetical protein